MDDPRIVASEPERARRTLWAGVVVFRVVSFAWMVAANLLAGESLRRPAVAWLAVGVTGLWVTYLTRTRTRSGWSLWVDLALSTGLILVSGWVLQSLSTRIFFATAYPASTALAWGAARGWRWGLGAGATLSVALALERAINGYSIPTLTSADVVSFLNGAVYYMIAGGAAGVVTRTIDRSSAELRAVVEDFARERERAARLAQFESTARRLHDTVLQMLALISKRGHDLAKRGSIRAVEVAELAELAGRQEDELRRWIRSGGAETGAGSDQAPSASLGATLEGVARMVPGAEAKVSSGGQIWLPSHVAGEIGDAVGEALRNVAKHADANETRVTAEVRNGSVEVSVRDDGRGFEVDTERFEREGRLGLRRSLIGRIEALGGRVTITSKPGSGSIVQMSVPLGSTRSSKEDAA